MKLIDHLNNITDTEARNKALANIDTRYQNDNVYTLNYAIMLGVYKHTKKIT